jgi:uncharacterized membrane protein YfcA
MLWLVAILGLCIGIAVGLLGAGASIFTVLLFLHVARLDLQSAIATSLAVVVVTSSVAFIPYARSGEIQWRTGVGFSLASTVGAYVGGRVSGSIPTKVLMMIFVTAMILAACAMLWKRSPRVDQARRSSRRRLWVVGAAALLIGSVTGTVGLGGGFAVVPLLVLVSGASMRSAVGTSIFVIAMNTAAALVGHLPHPRIDWGLASLVAVTASAGGLVGARLGKRINAEVLRRSFASLMLVAALAQLASILHR